MQVTIIGAGLSGCEAAYFLANHGFKVILFEMREKKQTEIHKTALFSELVCSNSLKAMAIENAHGLLKKELQLCNSLIIEAAYENQVAAGGALAVDRDKFAAYITNKIKKHPNIIFKNDRIKT